MLQAKKQTLLGNKKVSEPTDKVGKGQEQNGNWSAKPLTTSCTFSKKIISEDLFNLF